MSAAAFSGLCKRFGATTAIDQLSATLPLGGITGLVGPDGAGKTTLMRLLAGLMAPTAGTLTVLDSEPSAEGGAIQARVGYMPQRFGLYEDLSVRDNLRLYADLRGLDLAARTARFGELLQFTRLGPFQDRLAGDLSGGMKQKLGLACALLGRPQLLLLDEPSVGVDPLSRRELWAMVGDLAGQGMTVIWSTAYLDEAERCPRVLLLDRGRLLHAGPPADLCDPLRGRVFRRRAEAGEARALAERERGRAEVADSVIQGASVRIVAAAMPPVALAAAFPAALYTPVEPRLEDAYVERLGAGASGAAGGRFTPSRLAEGWPQASALGTPQVQAEGLTRRFGDFVAAQDIRFEVRAGEIYGLLGPNGAGKSTTFRMLCGLLRPTAGRATVAGVDLLGAASRARGLLGYMAQKFSLYGDLSVAQNLDYFARIYGLDRARARSRIAAMVELFDLRPHLAANAALLPLGYKQRLALACATLHAPAVLFLDEPTSGVDPLMRREFWHHIDALTRRGVAVLVTTHFMDEAEYCDRIGLIWQGRKIAEGSPDQLKASAATAELAEPTLEQAFIALIEREAA